MATYREAASEERLWGFNQVLAPPDKAAGSATDFRKQ